MEQFMVKEGQYLAVFNSAHKVMKAEDLLKSRGFRILLIPAPRSMQTDCGLAIRFNEEQRDGIMDLLAEHALLPAFVSRLENGIYITLEELSLENH